jgi:hypothetical protein
MIKTTFVALSALALAASACYGPGQRAVGAPGKPAVEYQPCCDGAAPAAKDGDWGLFCPGGGVATTSPPSGGGGGGGSKCYASGERAIGATGKPAVDYKPCCDGGAPVARTGDWGLFCPGGVATTAPPSGGGSTKCYASGERSIGAPGKPAVEYKPCCDGGAPAAKTGDWGLFCPGGGVVTTPPSGGGGGSSKCYASGERAIGAPGKPAVEYKPCCGGGAPVAKTGDWGLFCPGGGVVTTSPPSGCRRRRRRLL